MNARSPCSMPGELLTLDIPNIRPPATTLPPTMRTPKKSATNLPVDHSPFISIPLYILTCLFLEKHLIQLLK